jgi:acyl carrier protein phosphodiesterase
MNFLAHAHLSGENPQLLVGNMIADAVKGKQYSLFPEAVAGGILLHRKIDTFTDSHPCVKRSIDTIRKEAGRYSGVVVDIYYDHFLARCWDRFSEVPLDEFTVSVYRILGNHWSLLPARVKRMLPYMVAENWLNSYANLLDLKRIFYGMDRRTKLASGMSRAVEILEAHYGSLQKDFDEFYPEMIDFAGRTRQQITSKAVSSPK